MRGSYFVRIIGSRIRQMKNVEYLDVQMQILTGPDSGRVMLDPVTRRHSNQAYMARGIAKMQVLTEIASPDNTLFVDVQDGRIARYRGLDGRTCIPT